MDRQLNHTDAGPPTRPSKRQRKQRPCYSCEECRRLKMKCDRQVPCSNCVRRQRTVFCLGTGSGDSTSRTGDNSGSQDRQGIHKIRHAEPSVESPERTELNPAGSGIQPAHRDQQWVYNTTLERADAPLTNPGSRQGPRQVQQASTGTGPKSHPRDHPFIAGTPASNTVQGPAIPTATAVSHDTVEPAAGAVSSRDGGNDVPVTSSLQATGDEDNVGSHGTLMICRDGLSKYLGPTAGSEWLKDSETQEIRDSPAVTRAPSPTNPEHADFPKPNSLAHELLGLTFPFNASTANISTRELLKPLPPKEEAWTLVESYYRYCAWHHDVAPRVHFESTFTRVYAYKDGGIQAPRINAQEIALVYIIMAQGTMFNIEMPIYDSSVEEWLHLAERSLVKGDFLSSNTIAGLQTLHLMAHLHLQMDKGRRGDRAWPLWGLVMRLIQAMGLHRDGSLWNLPEDVVDQRRKVFWECNAADTFQAHCFSRPCAINPEHCDTAFPTDTFSENGVKSYSLLRFQLSQLSGEILNAAMKVRKPLYSQILALGDRLLEFERDVPFHLRCRAAFLSMPSRYPETQGALEASPEPSRRSMAISFQQTNLALNISETIVNLHRPYYAKTIYESPTANRSSTYAQSFMSVVERCAIIIAIVKDIHTRFPTVSTRQWNFWFHVFGSALCLGTLILRDPKSDMAVLVITQIDVAINLFKSLIQHGADTPRYQRNLQWLVKLRARAAAKVAAVSSQQSTESQEMDYTGSGINTADRAEDEHEELLGLRTRLIERAGQNQRTRKTIGFQDTMSRGSQQDCTAITPATSDAIAWSTTIAPGTGDSVGELLHDFWDPLLLQQSIIDMPVGQSDPSFGHGLAWWEDISSIPNGVQNEEPLLNRQNEM